MRQSTQATGSPIMPQEIEAFLTAYHPKFVCIPCLATMTNRGESDVRGVVKILLAERRADSQAGECMNCAGTAFVVRWRPPKSS